MKPAPQLAARQPAARLERPVPDDRSAARTQLDDDRRKRDRLATPEPFESANDARPERPRFVVHEHQARSLHYDLRLERHGVLASWALPKGVPLVPGERRLAVHVEDHPLDYASFQGRIPQGQYGAGSVEIWDSGWYELVDEKPDGTLTVRLRGRRLQGTWALVPAGLSGDPKNWLIVRKRERDAPTDPRRYAPMLATLADELPVGEGWSFEVKWDGYRALAYVSGHEVRLVSRNGNDLTVRFPQIAEAVASAVTTPDCVLDGEICALDERGRSSFSAMQQGKPDTPFVYYVFDLLELAGEPLIALQLVERRHRLQQLLEPAERMVALSQAFDDGEALMIAARELGLEGVIAKHVDSPYLPGKRSRWWLKVKTHLRQEFLIAGYTKGRGRRAGRLGALVLALRDEQGELVYVGNCGTGLTDETIEVLLERLRPLERATPPFAVAPKMPRVRQGEVVWVDPVLVCEVEFAGWTHEGRLRAPSFQGLREDKPPEDVHREEPPFPSELRRGRRVVRFSNLGKLFWPEEGISKGDLLRYYRAVAPVLVPYLRGRPFVLRRYPDGWQGRQFFQKDAPAGMPAWIARVPLVVTTEARRTRTIQAPVVNDELSLLWMINAGCIECHTWYSRVDRLDRPDWVLFDLDPSAGVGFDATVEATLLLKQALDALGLASFAKTSGADGMHVLMPLERRHTYADTRAFAATIARRLARTHPGLVTTEWSKARRRGVLIDANQNAQGKSIASVYSVRPKAGAPVSTALRWDEVNENLDPAAFSMDVVLARILEDGDLFAGVLATKQRLGRAWRVLEG